MHVTSIYRLADKQHLHELRIRRTHYIELASIIEYAEKSQSPVRVDKLAELRAKVLAAGEVTVLAERLVMRACEVCGEIGHNEEQHVPHNV
jgi:hypothetical protein